MNALDQAFIKAFAKDRKQAAAAPRKTAELHAQPQPPAEGVESVSLVLHDLYQQGKRLRVDRPSSDNVGLDAHLILPTVEHLESYDPADVAHATQPPIVIEDRLAPLEQIPFVKQPSDELGDIGENQNVPPRTGTLDSSPSEPEVESESNVVLSKDAHADMEVPALDLPASDPSRDIAAGSKTETQLESAEEQLLRQCQPHVLLAATQLDAPERMTHELMTCTLGQLDAALTSPLDAAVSEFEASPPAVDLDALAARCRDLPVADDRQHDPESTAVEQSPGSAKETGTVETNTGEINTVENTAIENTVVENNPVENNPVENNPVQFNQGLFVPPQPSPIRDTPIESAPIESNSSRGNAESSGAAEAQDAIEAAEWTETRVQELERLAPSAMSVMEADGASADAMSTSPVAGESQHDAHPETQPGTSAQPLADAFVPAWEVDAFRWPEICKQLDDVTDGRLTQSGDELFVATQDGLRVLAVTSTDRLEGRTTLALSLARTAARAGTRVALVDADAANPELARRLGMEAPCDWREVVSRGEPLSEAAVASLDDHVTLFPKTFPMDDESNSFDEVLLASVRELGKHFDLVVVDLPPVALGNMPGKGVLEPCPIDMVVVMRNVRATSQEQTMATVSSLRRLGVRAVGVVENFTPPSDT